MSSDDVPERDGTPAGDDASKPDEMPAGDDVPDRDETPGRDAGTAAGPDDGNGEGREWRFSVDEVGPDGVTENSSTPETEPIEPESVDLEHAVFVGVGVALTLGVLLLGF